MSDAPLIQLQGVSLAYAKHGGGVIQALRDVSLEVRRGEWLSIIGHNGSGKSSLAKLLNGLLVPGRGTVTVDGLDTRDEASAMPIRRLVGMVFQDPENQIVATTVEEDVAFGPENLGLARDEIARRVDAALETVGLEAFRERAPQHLSGGQKQRVSIAGVLAMRPACIVLDEATALLDPSGRAEVLDTIGRLHQGGVTVVHISHFMNEIVRADRVIVLSEGRIALHGTPREIFAQPARLRELELDVPQVTQVAEGLAARGVAIEPLPLAVDELAEAVARRAGSGPRTAEPPRRPETRAAGEPIIEIKELWHWYLRGTPLETVALRGVDFELRRGEASGIIGHTGSGKSTLAQHFNALLRPHRGSAHVAGHDLSDRTLDPRPLRRMVGLVFQFPEHQLFDPTVGDDIAFGPRRMGFPPVEVRRRVKGAMERMGLGFEDFKDRYTFGLSGGEMRRVALAGVLALEPDVLVLDEPTAGLDPRGRRDLLRTLAALHAEGTSLVFVSHNMDEVAELVERVWVLAGGRTVLQGTVREVFREVDRLRELGLGIPQVTELAHALRDRDVPVPTDVLTVGEATEAVWTSLSSRVA